MSLDTDIALLRRLPLIGRFEPEALRLLAFAAETRILRAGDVLFRRGEPCDGGYVVVSGSLALDASEDGADGAFVAEAGSLIGELALFCPGERPGTAIAREATTVMKLPAKLVRRVLSEFPASAQAAHAMLAERVRHLTADLAAVRAQLLAIDRPAARPR